MAAVKNLKRVKNPNSKTTEKKILSKIYERNIKTNQRIDYKNKRHRMTARDIDKKIETLELEIKLGKIKLADVEKQLNNLKLQAFEENIREEDNRQLLKG